MPVESKLSAFDVVSIKPAHPGDSWHYGFDRTGYSAAGITLNRVIYQAYFERNMAGKDPLIGAPDWVSKDLWDIEGKVAPEDLAEYQRELMAKEIPNPATRQMLQQMLADRCKLVVHRVPVEIPAFAIVIANNGPKLTQAAPNQAQPSASLTLPGGGFFVPWSRPNPPILKFYAVSMATFAQHLRGITGGPVVDRTGLTGKYDFSLNWLSLDPDEREGFISFDDPYPLSHWNFGALGLKIERIRIPAENIVIDHIEKPSEN